MMAFLLSTILVFVAFGSIESFIYRHVNEIPPFDSTGLKDSLSKWNEIEQALDHFNPMDNRTWKMRYIENTKYLKHGGPLFIFCGGEWQISESPMTSGQLHDMAKDHSGYMVYSEHRYYGDSMPTETLSTENLQYLSVDQAIMDIIYLIDYLKSSSCQIKNSKVVLVGGSYSGTVAAFARYKFPHIVDVAYASSAPVKAVTDFYEYLEVVNNNIKAVDEECLSEIQNGIQQTERLLNSPEGIEQVSRAYNTCSIFKNEEPDRSLFFSFINEVFMTKSQYARNNSIKKDCDDFMSYNGTAFERLSRYIGRFFEEECIGDYDEMLEIYTSTNLSSSIERTWTYQTCTEFGFFMTTTSDNQPFGKNVPLEFSKNLCQDVYSSRWTENVLNRAITRTNLVFGSQKPNVSKIIFSNGLLDPWHKLSVLVDLSPTTLAIVIRDAAHCADLGSVNENDSIEMKGAKIKIKKIIADWIK